MGKYLISHENVTYYLKFLTDSNSRTIIVGLQQLLFSIECGAVLVPHDRERIVTELLRIIQFNNDPRVRQWCYMLGAFLISEQLTNLCLRKIETEIPKNQSWMLALLSNNMEEKQFLKFRKKAEHFLSKDVINLCTYLFSNNQFDKMDNEYINGILNRADDELALLWIGWIATFHNQDRKNRGFTLIDAPQMSQMTGFKEDNVLKHIMAAYSRHQLFTVDSLQFDVFDYAHMESEHKKWTLTTIWKDEIFVEQNKDYFFELMSKRHLFQLCDKRVREGLASGLSTYKYDDDFVYYVLDWYSNEPEDSVKHFLLSYMLNWQNKNDDYNEMISSVLVNGTEKEKLLIQSKSLKEVIKLRSLSINQEFQGLTLLQTGEESMLSNKNSPKKVNKCEEVLTSKKTADDVLKKGDSGKSTDMSIINPKVFISYSWSSEEYKSSVLHLATKLRRDGVDVILDRWDLKSGNDKYYFMENSIAIADKVLILCDSRYVEKANSRVGGVGDETAIITPDIYGNNKQEKFIPVLMEGPSVIPKYLKGRIGVDLTPGEFNKKYKELLRVIFEKPIEKKPTLGQQPKWLK